MAARLVIENEVEVVFDAQPVEEREAGLEELQVLLLPRSVLVVVLPGYVDDLDQEIHASLKGLDARKLRDGTLAVEMLDPASSVFNNIEDVFHKDHIWGNNWELRELIKEVYDIWQADQTRNLQVLLFQQSAWCSHAA